FIRHLGSLMPPWILDDADPRTRIDQDLRVRIEHIVQREIRALQRASLCRGTPEFNLRLALDLLVQIMLPRHFGGLGLRYRFSPDNTHHRLDGIQTWRAGYGDCNSLSFIFYALAARAGLNPRFIRVLEERNSSTGEWQTLAHIGVAVALDPSNPSRLTALDPSRSMILR